MTQIICLANSWKRGDRCIAGINLLKAQWIRPVSSLPDGRVPKEMRLIGDRTSLAGHSRNSARQNRTRFWL